MLKTPATVMCESREKTLDIPQVPTEFGYSEEFVLNDGADLTYIKDLYYSFDKRALRYETRSPVKSSSNYFVTDSLLIISDYYTGVQYAINKNLGKIFLEN